MFIGHKGKEFNDCTKYVQRGKVLLSVRPHPQQHPVLDHHIVWPNSPLQHEQAMFIIMLLTCLGSTGHGSMMVLFFPMHFIHFHFISLGKHVLALASI